MNGFIFFLGGEGGGEVGRVGRVGKGNQAPRSVYVFVCFFFIGFVCGFVLYVRVLAKLPR